MQKNIFLILCVISYKLFRYLYHRNLYLFIHNIAAKHDFVLKKLTNIKYGAFLVYLGFSIPFWINRHWCIWGFY